MTAGLIILPGDSGSIILQTRERLPRLGPHAKRGASAKNPRRRVRRGVRIV